MRKVSVDLVVDEPCVSIEGAAIGWTSWRRRCVLSTVELMIWVIVGIN